MQVGRWEKKKLELKKKCKKAEKGKVKGRRNKRKRKCRRGKITEWEIPEGRERYTVKGRGGDGKEELRKRKKKWEKMG